MVLKNLKKTTFLKNSFENNIMINGLKTLAEKQFLKSMLLLQKSSLKNYKLILLLAIINNMPILYLKKLKKKKKQTIITYIPYTLATQRIRNNFTIKLIIKKLRKNNNDEFFKLKLKNIILKSSKDNVEIIDSKRKLHELVYIKKTFSHFRWF